MSRTTLLVKFVDIDSTDEVASLFEVDLQKPRNLSAHESEECEHGEVRVKKTQSQKGENVGRT